MIFKQPEIVNSSENFQRKPHRVKKKCRAKHKVSEDSEDKD